MNLKKDLVKAWRSLENKELGKNDKTDAYSNIIHLSNKLRESDKEFFLDEKALEKYKEFATDYTPQLNKKVKWAKHDKNGKLGDLENDYNLFVETAVKIVSKRIPDTDTDTDKFGTIVNATIANLIAMSKH